MFCKYYDLIIINRLGIVNIFLYGDKMLCLIILTDRKVLCSARLVVVAKSHAITKIKRKHAKKENVKDLKLQLSVQFWKCV